MLASPTPPDKGLPWQQSHCYPFYLFRGSFYSEVILKAAAPPSSHSADITVLTSLTQSCEGRRAPPPPSVTVLGLPLMGIDSCWPAKRPSLTWGVCASCVCVGSKAGHTVLCGNKRVLNMYAAVGGSICGQFAVCVSSGRVVQESVTLPVFGMCHCQ